MSPTLHRLQPHELPALQALAAADSHAVLYPTHAVRKDGAMVGYVSLFATPIVNVWLHTQHVHAADSLRLLAALDGHCQIAGVDSYIMPCAKSSPFFPHMQRLGFRVLGENVWHIKQLGRAAPSTAATQEG